MKPTIDTVYVLAGGKGSRLAPWPAPKCTIPVNGIPMIGHILDHVTQVPDVFVDRVIVCTGYRADNISALLDWAGYSQVEFFNAGENAAMCDRLLGARKELGDPGRSLTCYGDEIVDVDMAALVRHHESNRAALTFVVCKQAIPFGVVKSTDAVQFGGRRIQAEQDVLVNIGFVLAEPEAWDFMRTGDGLSDWVNRVGDAGRNVACFVHRGKRATINNLADLEHAESVWR